MCWCKKNDKYEVCTLHIQGEYAEWNSFVCGKIMPAVLLIKNGKDADDPFSQGLSLMFHEGR